MSRPPLASGRTLSPRSPSVVLAIVLTLVLGAALSVPVPEARAQDADNMVHDTTAYSALDYRMIGPYRGGRSSAVTGVPGKPHTYFMGTTGGGVWVTRDGGESWENISDGFFDVASVGHVEVASSDPNVIYVGTGSADIRGNTSTGRGVYRSHDGGETWEFAGLPEAGQIGDIVVHPKDADRLYVAALGHPFGPNPQRGVFRSTDGGDSWEKVLFISDSTGAQSLAMNPHNPREIYAGMWRAERKPWVIVSGAEEGGIWKTTDGGDSWEKLEKDLPDGPVGKTSVTVSPANPDRVWALLEAPQPEAGLYRSDDGGESWTQVNTHNKLTQRAYYYIHVIADPKDENTLYVLNVNFHKSVDGGKSFEEIDVPHGDVHDLWVNPHEPEKMVVANDGGAQVSVNGGESWTTYHNQPTAELYSVTVDDQFPYRVYAPQQDNSTISLPSNNQGGIHPKQFWYSVGGCETGPVALDPDDPNVVWAGCYGGTITRVDREKGTSRNMLIYPQLQLGQKPADLKYRFQWVSPIVVSPHDPGEVYHASQHVHRTTDGGYSWETISPDLTTDTEAHQDWGGRPITNEATGVEVFNTIFSLRISPHSNDVIWAGTDDGRVWISRDHGQSWDEITPDGMPRFGTVDAIDPSPHTPGKAYMAVHRYRMDDWKPYVYRTTDYGRSWTLLTSGRNGIPADHPVRVVREDTEREGLLYAGTEFGVFVSFDDGAHWQTLQQDLPVTPVTDLKVHRGDLVVATQGRSLWILDDLSPLRQLSERVTGADAHLFDPRPAYRTDYGFGGFGDSRWPEGPPRGALIHYHLAGEPDTTLTVRILEADGDTVRSYASGADEEDGGEPLAAFFGGGGSDRAPAEAGLNRLRWNLRHSGVDEVDDAVLWGFTGGTKAVPGSYTVELEMGDVTRRTELELRLDPRLTDVSRGDLEEQLELATAIRDTMNSLYDAVRKLSSVRKQVKSVAEAAKEGGHDEELSSMADSVVADLTSLEEEILQTKAQSGQDIINFPPRLDNQYAALYGYTAGPDGRPTEGAYTRFDDLNATWAELRSRLASILEDDVAAFNAAVSETGAGPVIVPSGRSGGGGGGASRRR